MTSSAASNAQRAQNCAPVASLTQTQAATLMNISRRTVQHAHVVARLGIPELRTAVERGEMAVSLASEIARAPADVQCEAIAGGWAVAKAIAKRIKQERQARRHAEERVAWRAVCAERGARHDA